jgi:hypothetical protein
MKISFPCIWVLLLSQEFRERRGDKGKGCGLRRCRRTVALWGKAVYWCCILVCSAMLFVPYHGAQSQLRLCCYGLILWAASDLISTP